MRTSLKTLLKLRVQATNGDHPRDIAADLVRLAEKLEVDVIADINRVDMFTWGGASAEEVWENWRRQMRLQDELRLDGYEETQRCAKVRRLDGVEEQLLLEGAAVYIEQSAAHWMVRTQMPMVDVAKAVGYGVLSFVLSQAGEVAWPFLALGTACVAWALLFGLRTKTIFVAATGAATERRCWAKWCYFSRELGIIVDMKFASMIGDYPTLDICFSDGSMERVLVGAGSETLWLVEASFSQWRKRVITGGAPAKTTDEKGFHYR
jgi:hypothetical protein